MPSARKRLNAALGLPFRRSWHYGADLAVSSCSSAIHQAEPSAERQGRMYPGILQDAIDNWPEDEAYGLWEDLIQSVPGDEPPMPGQLDRAITHMLNVFNFEDDAEQLKARFFAELDKLTT